MAETTWHLNDGKNVNTATKDYTKTKASTAKKKEATFRKTGVKSAQNLKERNNNGGKSERSIKKSANYY